MLVLSRKKNESIIIGGNIEIKIIESDDGKVRIGIDAPKEIEIHRKEVFDLIMEENKAAMNTKSKLDQLKGKKLNLNMKTDNRKKQDKMLK
ncbi:carbon storage regulator CsrA [Acidaminobacter sp. JC074]|uniref:carbon storage regulator CsrA n=1 Tax=Acidaminobacter sp. JC074 TaxID=2530199 RepID=UPI001F10BC1B|nr:carbon storage regulator CsrA [Acidaminobacter sp. JC074]MCH4889296.1 carbon storage regulator CsrA [Acidaminobacter sp. JC074]